METTEDLKANNRFSLASVVQGTKSYWSRKLSNKDDNPINKVSAFDNQMGPTKRTSISSFNVQMNPISYKLYGSGNRVEAEQLKMENAPRFTIHPHSNFRILWDLTTVLILGINTIFIPYNIAFYSDEKYKDIYVYDGLFFFSDVWFLIDMMLNFRTGILDPTSGDNEIVFNPHVVRKNYIRSWFLIDLISSVPWDVLGDTLKISKLTTMDYFKLLRLMKVLKLLRITRMAKALKQWEDVLDFQYNISINEYAIKMIKLCIYLFTTVHINACVLFLVPSFTGFPGANLNDEENGHIGPTWPYLRNLTEAEPHVQYSWSVFKATSHMLVIGYGQAPPQCTYDMWTSIVSMISGAVIFALMISEITSIIQSMNSSASAYKEKLTQVKEYMDFCKVPRELRNRVREYYEVKYQGKMFNENAILDELNPLLREKVINFNCRSLVKSVEFLATADPDFVSDLISYLNVEVYLQGDKIIEEGNIGNQMYFISQGSVSVTTKINMRPRILSEGEHFGEICLFVSNLKRTATVLATTNCYVYTLKADDFNSTLRWYPSEKIEMQRVAIERMEILLSNVKRASKHTRAKSRAAPTSNEVDIDDEIYQELEQQRDALIELQQRTQNQIRPPDNA